MKKIKIFSYHDSAGHSNPACFGKFLQHEPPRPSKVQHIDEIDKASLKVRQLKETVESIDQAMKKHAAERNQEIYLFACLDLLTDGTQSAEDKSAFLQVLDTNVVKFKWQAYSARTKRNRMSQLRAMFCSVYRRPPCVPSLCTHIVIYIAFFARNMFKA